MKYLIFTAALFCVLPASGLMILDRRLLRYAVLIMILPVLFFSATSINFFSQEWYRGTSRGMEVSIIYLAAVAILTALICLRGFRTPFPGISARLYLLYFLFSLPSLLTAENTLFSFFEIWKMIMVYLVYLAIYYYLEYSRGDFQILLTGFSILTFFIFLSVVQQHFAGIYQVRAQFPHQNSLAMFMEILGTLFLSCFLNRRFSWQSWIFLGLFCLASGTLFRTYSRGAIACYPVACAVTIIVSLLYDLKARKIQALLIMALIGFLIIAAFTPRLIERFESAPKSSGETRLNFAIAAKNMIEDEPIFGIGLNNWGIKINPPYPYSEHRDASKGYTREYKDGIVETIYLLVCAECGIPALLLLLALFGYHWYLAKKLSRELCRTEYFYLPAGIIGGLTGVYLQSVLEWVLKQQVNFLELLIVFAMLTYMNQHFRELKKGFPEKSGGLAI